MDVALVDVEVVAPAPDRFPEGQLPYFHSIGDDV